ncbi:MAG TPA: bifunctional DNA-formamidopyrimidine glycosylase/DNA-(apurinic or apyrimidinic site) lyase [Gemmatimonadaceae bacterium]|nr:bifunctional DNA-formamidopyrimidine glycosylase/DNA-(apurinic or apyrimidinic site) lyase [Gemmatimonadaceae bacterium]
MPELPETETIARDLHAMLAGAVITGAQVLRGDVLRSVTPDAFVQRLTGTAIVQAWRRAKLIILDLDSADALVVQPRFTGAMLVESQPEDISDRDRSYITLSVALSDGRLVHYRDIRRLGTVALLTRAELRAYLSPLGPEPLDPALTAERFSGSLRKSRQAVKKVLMDQQVVAGVGNIYANEACWMAGIDPSRTADSLHESESALLLHSLREVLTASIAVRGTSFRDYVDARGGRGGFVPFLQVYGRGGQPCTRCGTTLVDSAAIDGRTTVFCWRCQE